MGIDSLLLRGELHEVYGEDAQFYTNLGENWFIAAVMDGCSSGTESYFASVILAKILKKNCKTLPLLVEINPDLDLDSFSPESMGEFLLNQVFEDLKQTRKLLLSDKYELLSTLILLVYHKPTKSASIVVSGDGFVKIDQEIIEIDQQNVPDYMAYHFDLTFEKWLKNHIKTYKAKGVESVSISTDGIAKLFNDKRGKSKKINPMEYLFAADSESLKEKYEILKDKYKLIPFDDISIITIKS